MKKTLRIGLAAISLLAVVPVPSEAGTFFLGAKGWYCTWDSGILDWLEKDIALSFLGNRVQFQAEDDPGSGYLAGPLVGYQTDNGKWSFSFAAMVFSHFNQDWSGSAAGMNLGGSVDLSRRDYDFAANYNLSQYFNVYAGLKYQDMEMDYTLSTTTVIGTQSDMFSVDAEALMLSLGIGGAYPLHPKLVVSGQAGILWPIMDMKVTDQNGRSDDILPHSNLGYNLEANLTYQPWEHFILQAGYRYQYFEFDARGPGRTTTVTSKDITYGPTLAIVVPF